MRGDLSPHAGYTPFPRAAAREPPVGGPAVWKGPGWGNLKPGRDRCTGGSALSLLLRCARGRVLTPKPGQTFPKDLDRLEEIIRIMQPTCWAGTVYAGRPLPSPPTHTPPLPFNPAAGKGSPYFPGGTFPAAWAQRPQERPAAVRGALKTHLVSATSEFGRGDSGSGNWV